LRWQPREFDLNAWQTDHVEHKVQGRHSIEAGQAIDNKTVIYELQTGKSAVLKGPGGTITLDDGGITLDGVAIMLKGGVAQSAGGASPVALPQGVPEKGVPLDVLCTKQTNGTCPLSNRRCGRYVGG
jgi:type VI secretion system secreted protein VgrG